MAMTDFFDDSLEIAERPERDEDLVKRDQWGRPEIVPPGEDEPVGYTRITTFVKQLDRTFHLGLYQQRLVMEGCTRRPDLLLRFAATLPGPSITMTPDKMTKKALNSLVWQAMNAAHDDVGVVMRALLDALEITGYQNDIVTEARETAGDGVKAQVGTELHTLADRMDLGLEIGYVPPQWADDVKTYARLTRAMEPVEIEGFVVHDDLQVAGTPDRIWHVPTQPCILCESPYYVGDLKTGNVEFSPGTIAGQLAMGAHGLRYDPRTMVRWVRLQKVCEHRGIIVHLGAGTGQGKLEWAKIDRAWRFMPIFVGARDFASYSDWTTPMEAGDELADLIVSATTRIELTEIRRHANGEWTEGHSAMANARWKELR